MLNELVAQKVQEKNATVLVSMPPRHGKSLLLSNFTPPWYLGRRPRDRVLLWAYSSKFAATWGRKSRDVLKAVGPALFNVRVREDSRAADEWEIEDYGGGMFTAGVQAGITGRGFNLGLIDDYCKNAEEALSVTVRNKVWDEYTTSFITRKEPGAAEIDLATRWHSDDLFGRIIADAKDSGRKITIINLPAIAEDDDPLGRKPGEALWPERFPIEKLRELERTMSFWFASLYQGRPVPMGGALFLMDWFKRFAWIGEAGPRFDGLVMLETARRYMRRNVSIVMVVDPSLGQKNSDKVAVAICALTDDLQRCFVLHCVSARIPIDVIVDRLDRLAREWRVEACLMEANGFQVQLAKSARAKLPCPVREIDPEGKSKLSRGIPAIELCASGDMLLPENAPWVVPYVGELCNWRGRDGDIDDQVDVTAYAVKELMSRRLATGDGSRPKGGPSMHQGNIRRF